MAGKEGYIFVYQDVRGRWMSEGEFVNMRPHRPGKKGPAEIDESSDTWDTIEWLLGHVPGHNGKVGLWGVSYPGFYATAGMIDAHPALAAVSPQAPICDWFVGDDWHHHGALMLPHAFNFMANFGRPRPEPTTKSGPRFEHNTPDGYRFFLDMGPPGDVMRGKFRNSFEHPEPFVPDQPTVVKFTLQDVCHSFRVGHRVMAQVQSTWFPLIDRNPQTFVDIDTAKETDFRKSTQAGLSHAGAAVVSDRAGAVTRRIGKITQA